MSRVLADEQRGSGLPINKAWVRFGYLLPGEPKHPSVLTGREDATLLGHAVVAASCLNAPINPRTEAGKRILRAGTTLICRKPPSAALSYACIGLLPIHPFDLSAANEMRRDGHSGCPRLLAKTRVQHCGKRASSNTDAEVVSTHNSSNVLGVDFLRSGLVPGVLDSKSTA